MIVNYTVYDSETGRILRSGFSALDTIETLADPGESLLLEPSNGALQYVVNGEVVNRPTMGVPTEISVVADGETQVDIDNLPSGVEAQIDGMPPVVLPDTTLSLVFDAPGTYTLYLRRFPYIDAQVTIHAD